MKLELPLHITLVQRIRARLLARFGYGVDRLLEKKKWGLLSDKRGTVLEIGPGTGTNLRYLVSDVNWIGVEPNQFMYRHLYAALDSVNIRGKIVGGNAESIPIKSNYADVVICTFVLCSVKNPTKTLAEIQRVLKTEGLFIFIEHVAAKQGSRLRMLQEVISPLWRIIGDGCYPNREIDKMIIDSGFKMIECNKFDLHGSSIITPNHIIGQAINGTSEMINMEDKKMFQLTTKEAMRSTLVGGVL